MERNEKESRLLAALTQDESAWTQLPEGFRSSDFTVSRFGSLYAMMKAQREIGGPVTLEAIKELFPEQAVVWAEVNYGPQKLNGQVRSIALSLMGPVIDTSQFGEMGPEDVLRVLGQTIREDRDNSMITFAVMLSAFSEDSQLSLAFLAETSSGKSYIPSEIARLFPAEDVQTIGYASPASFFHSGEFDPVTKTYRVDLERKIIVFADMPHPVLLERLRPVLSHDQKEIVVKISDKTQKSGYRTRHIILRGYPAVCFCTANLKIDQQEASRMFLLSPEVSQQKIRGGILEKILRETDREAYYAKLDANPDRQQLKQRIRAIKQARISDINIGNPDHIERVFLESHSALKPRHQRDIGRIIGLAKCFCLLNLWHRPKEGSTITTSEDDVEHAFQIWERISESQENNLPPAVWNLFRDVIVPAFKGRPEGVPIKVIVTEYRKKFGRSISPGILRGQIIPALHAEGLVDLESDPEDRRRKLLFVI